MLNLTLERTHKSLDSRQLLEDLYQSQRPISFKKGQFIPMESGNIFVVYRGLVKLNMLYPNGDEGILGLAHSSMPFGLPLTQLDSYEAIALTDVLLMQIDLGQIDESPLLARSLFREMKRRLQQTEALLAIARERRVENRLRSLLKLLGEEIGQVTVQGIRLEVRLTHQQIGEMIGTTRVTITRLLQDFRTAGWVEIDATRHLLIKPDGDTLTYAA